MINIKAYEPTVRVINKKVNGEDYHLGKWLRRAKGSSHIERPANTVRLDITPNARLESPNWTGNVIPFWLKTIEINDIIEVGIEEQKSFLFKVDGVVDYKSHSEFGVEHGVTIAGRSMTSLLLDDFITFAPELATDKRAIEILGESRATFLGILRGLTESGGSEFLAQNPLAAILWIFINMPSVNSKIRYADYDEKGEILSEMTDKVGKLFDFNLMAYEGDLLYDVGLTQYSGPVWNYVMQCINPMFYEVFEESIVNSKGELRPTIFVRPKPFDRTTDNTAGKDKILNLKVERNGKVEDGDFNITKNEKKFRGTTGKSWDVTVKHFTPGPPPRYEDNGKLERAVMYWDNDQSYPDFSMSPESEEGGSIQENRFETIITKDWYHTLSIEEEFSKSVGVSRGNIVNFITMHSTKETLVNTELARLGYLFPLLDSYSILKFGISRMEGRSNLLHFDTSIETTVGQEPDEENTKGFSTILDDARVFPLEESVKLRDRLFNWNRYNPIQMEGIIVCLGHDYYRKGDKLFVPHHYTKDGHEGVYYYIVGVDWDWNIDQGKANYLSRLQVTRGENPQQIEEYRFATGYDLFDRGINSEGDRINPVIKVDVVQAPVENQSAGQTQENQQEEQDDTRSYYTGNDNDRIGGKLNKKALEKLNSYYETHQSKYEKEGVTVQDLVTALEKAGRKNSINANILFGLFAHESAGFNPHAKNPNSSATGLAQFINGSAIGEGLKIDKSVGKGSLSQSQINADERCRPLLAIEKGAQHLAGKGWTKDKIQAIKNYGEGTESYYGHIYRRIVGDTGYNPVMRKPR